MRAALIAAKELTSAKTRLRSAFNAEERAALAQAMFTDVLRAVVRARRPQLAVVISADARLLRLATRAGALAIDEEFSRGLNVAVRSASQILARYGVTECLTVLSDIPSTRPEDIDSLFDAMPPAGGVVMVPSRERTGTNLLLRKPPEVIPTRFGRNSLMRHLEECTRRHVTARILHLPGPAIDLDNCEDLREFLAQGSDTETFRVLSQIRTASS